MRAEIVEGAVNGMAGGKLVQVVKLDPNAVARVQELFAAKKRVPNWTICGKSFEELKIQPGTSIASPPNMQKGKLGIPWTHVATTEPQWFIKNLNAEPENKGIGLIKASK
jgi:hypothetical protein